MAESNYKFEGWLGLDPDSQKGNMVWGQYEPKAWEDDDIDIKVTHSSICGSDLHMLRSGWGPAPYPICVGHEIVGTAVRVGSKADGNIKVGDRVGVGAQADSCMGRWGECENCATDHEPYCDKHISTYGAFHFNGGKAMGGHGTYHRAKSHFVIKIPEGLSSEYAAPMMCGGVTSYSPLKFHGAGPGKKVGILGVGGLGHFGVLFAKALGADTVVGFSRKANKKDEVLRMGADAYVATEEGEEWKTNHRRTFDLIVSTMSSSQAPLGDYLNLLKRDGTFVQIGFPDDGFLKIHPLPLLQGRVKVTGSSIGAPKDIREMLQLAADKDLKPMVELRPMTSANEAMVDMLNGKARYRYVLTN